ncbi:MAG TPA: S9 family peptidase [Blastocatellia bacterium]|jgi:dipeptidyl aminopeptidase/acylaminoacyl peptidase|nr:S9 family peptidase [Blastocatellia bacterium]
MKKHPNLLLFSVAILALSLCGTDAVSAFREKRMTIEDALAIRQIGAPQFSPDGKRIAYTISEWDREENRRVSHIWLVSSDGGPTAKLTTGDKGEISPQWSPDGLNIAFLADRDKGNQVWVIPVDGGEADKLTSEENDVQSFQWSPDGATIAFVTRDTPKDRAEREKRRKEKFDTIVVDSDFTYSHLWTLNVETREKKRLTEGDFTVSDPQWSPDGASIAFVMSKGGFQESSFIDISDDRNTDIYIVSVKGGSPRQLTTNPGPDANPRWSPDGKLIAYTSTPEQKSWAAKTDAMVISPDGGAPRNLTKDFYESANSGESSLAWTPDGNTLYFSSGVGLYTHIFSVPVGGGEVTQVTRESRNYNAFDISGHPAAANAPTPAPNPSEAANTPNWKIAYTVNDSFTADDIWVAPIRQIDQAKKITWVNPQIRDFALAKTRVIKWKGPDNLDVEGLLVSPLGYEEGKRYPLILQIHGGPYGRFTDTFNSRSQLWAAKGYAVLMPNPRGSTGYGNRFATANIGDWGGKDFKDIMAGVDSLIARGIADPDKLVVMGGSYGGFMTFWTITQTDRFKAAIGHAGISDWTSFHGQSDVPGLMEYGLGGQPWASAETYRKWSPMTHVDRVKTPLLITHGERDLRVPIVQAEQYYRALKMRGVETVFLRYPREGHGIQEPNHQIDLFQRQLEWFDTHLGIKREKPSETKATAATVNQK